MPRAVEKERAQHDWRGELEREGSLLLRAAPPPAMTGIGASADCAGGSTSSKRAGEGIECLRRAPAAPRDAASRESTPSRSAGCRDRPSVMSDAKQQIQSYKINRQLRIVSIKRTASWCSGSESPRPSGGPGVESTGKIFSGLLFLFLENFYLGYLAFIFRIFNHDAKRVRRFGFAADQGLPATSNIYLSEHEQLKIQPDPNHTRYPKRRGAADATRGSSAAIARAKGRRVPQQTVNGGSPPSTHVA